MNLLNIAKNWVSVNLFRKPVPGLIDERDSRNFKAASILGPVRPEDLTNDEFQTCHPTLAHQGFSDFCVGFSKAYFKQATEGEIMSGAGAFAMGCRQQGYIGEYGISILQVMKGAVRYGVPRESMWPYKEGSRDFLANWKNMSGSVLEDALRHRDSSFFVVSGAGMYDQFDTFRGYLNRLRARRIVIQTGVDAHAVTLIGQKYHNGELCLFGPDSYGKNNSKYRIGSAVNGYRYFNRWETNQLFEGYVAIDMPRAVAELLNRYDGKAVKLAEDKDCYIVTGGKRRLLRNEPIAWAHGCLLDGDDNVATITVEEMETLPLGPLAVFEEGPNNVIVRRMLEKVGKTELITAE